MTIQLINCGGGALLAHENKVIFLVIGDILIFGRFDNYTDLMVSSYKLPQVSQNKPKLLITAAGVIPHCPDKKPIEHPVWAWSDFTNEQDRHKIRETIYNHKEQLCLTYKE